MKTKVEQITLEEMCDELRREVAMRKRVYPRWIEIGKMTNYEADLQMLKITACLAFVESELKKNDVQGDLFG